MAGPASTAVRFSKTNPNATGSVAPPGLEMHFNLSPMGHAMGFRSWPSGPPYRGASLAPQIAFRFMVGG